MRHVTALLAGLMFFSTAPAPTKVNPPAVRPVVLELFTSQGCSSCPPADALLSTLAAEPSLHVIPLSFHVDYWNHLGWRDPYSAASWSARQSRYAQHLGSSSVYTPQLVIDGSSEYVGSNARAIRAAIAKSAATPFDATVTLTATTLESGVLDVAYDVAPRLDLRRDVETSVIVYEKGLDTAVARGENGGRRLHNDFVVRTLVAGPAAVKRRGSVTHGALRVRVQSEWRKIGVVVLVTDPETLRVIGAASREL